jgi:hypothetical protein
MALVRRGYEFADENPLLGFAGDDPDLLSLVAAFALQDIEDIESRAKRKARYDMPPSDAEIALRLQAEEAAGLMKFSNDAILARSIDSALSSDRGVLAQAVQEEVLARHDRDVAVALSEGRQPPPRPSTVGRPATSQVSSSRKVLAYVVADLKEWHTY